MTRAFNELAEHEMDEMEQRFQVYTAVRELGDTPSEQARPVSVTDLVRYARDIGYDISGTIDRMIVSDPWVSQNWNDILQRLHAGFFRPAAAAANDDVIVLYDESRNEAVALRQSVSEPDLYVLVVTLSETRAHIPTRLSVTTGDKRADLALPAVYRNQYQIDLEADDPIIDLLRDDNAQVVIW